MGHDVLEVELEDLRLWIAAILPKQEPNGRVDVST